MTSSRHRDVIESDTADVVDDPAITDDVTVTSSDSRVTDRIVYRMIPDVHSFPLGNQSLLSYIMPNTHRRRDSTVELSRIGGVYTIRN